MADPVWLLVMFDLPVKTKIQTREANRYRKFLKDQGFDRVQLSVYAKYFVNATGTVAVLTRVKSNLPLEGALRVLRISDSVWSAAELIENLESKPVPKAAPQLLLFE